jgi:hypothetical protein
MPTHHETLSESLKLSGQKKSGQRKPYRKPQLTDLGDLRTLTLGPSPSGYRDSGGFTYSETFPVPPSPVSPPGG